MEFRNCQSINGWRFLFGEMETKRIEGKDRKEIGRIRRNPFEKRTINARRCLFLNIYAEQDRR